MDAPRLDDQCQALEALSAPWAQDDQVWSNYGIIDFAQTFLGYLPTPRLFRPTNPYEVSNAIREAEAFSATKTIRALGSGWSFSDAALPQSTAFSAEEQLLAFPFEVAARQGVIDEPALRSLADLFEAHFGYAIDTSTLDRSLQTLLPDLLVDHELLTGLFFVEGGMTLYDLNILLDSRSEKERLALKTMGGASAQTIAGAISTGTHGGDFDRPPLADNVRAIYLIGAGGVHHWIEPADPITERAKVRAVFPCIADEHIHYNDDMFRAALVSMGAMGVIYAVILEVVPQYSLLQFNRWSTWDTLIDETQPNDFVDLFSGAWSGVSKYLEEQFPGLPAEPNRFLQVVINPIRDSHGEHACYVTNRIELPLQVASGVTPLDYGQVVAHVDWVMNAILNAPECDDPATIKLGIANAHGDFEPKSDAFELARTLITWCKQQNFPWVIRTVVDLIMQKSFPSSGQWTSVWDPMGGQWPDKPVVGVNPSRGLSVFLVGEDLHRLFRYDQDGPSGPWTLNPAVMGDPGDDWSHDQPPVVATNHSGGLSVFLVGKDDRLYRYDQDEPTGQWTSAIFTGHPGDDWHRDQPPVVATNPTGGLSVFWVGHDLHRLMRYDQDGPTGHWGDRVIMGDPGDDWSHDQPPVVATNHSGGLSVFLVGKDDRLYRYDQDEPTGQWTSAIFTGHPGDDWHRDQPPVVATNPTGGLSVFWVGHDLHRLMRYDQDGPTGHWGDRVIMGDPGDDWSHDQPPVVATNHSGGLSVFLVGKDLHNLFRFDQDGATGQWSVATTLGGDWSRDQPPVVVANHSGGLTVFLVGKDLHNLFRYDEDGPTAHWSGPAAMGGDWSQDHPVVVRGSPYTGMCVFLIAKDQGGLGSLLGGALGGAVLGALTEGLAGALGGIALGAALGEHLADAAVGGPALCRYDLSSPQFDVGYRVMVPAASRPTRMPALAGTAVEAAFSFFPTVPSDGRPDLRVEVPNVITFVDSVLENFDKHVQENTALPAGWVSLRVTGRTDALLGMQHFDRSGMVEIVLIGNPDDYGVVQELEQIALDQGGFLHWGQSTGLMDFPALESAYRRSHLDLAGIDKWKAAQRILGRDTFTNLFMRRCGLG